jgi:ureidoglycolate lyase
MSDIVLRASALTAEEFAPFGEVIEIDARASRWINDGTCRRFDDLAQVDVMEAGGRPLISIFEATPRPMPFRIRAIERHPISSQAFFPLEARRFLIVVAGQGSSPIAERLRVYVSSGAQGVNYRRNTWHHPLIALDQPSRFLVVDRGGQDENCEQFSIDDNVQVSDR